jgi:lysophospholipid acyltransferase (LPLAT)-like uncharacterized protein
VSVRRPLTTEPEVLQALKLGLGPVAWWLLGHTVRMPEFSPGSLESRQPLIFACLHRDILLAIRHVRPMRPSLLVSGSPDGDILIRALGRRHYGFVRGATGEDGKRAFVALRRELQRGRSVGVAVDGPKGPFGVINEGVLQLSRLSGCPIVPLRAHAPRRVVLGTWDRTVVPHLFSRVQITRGPLVLVAREGGEAELARVRRELAAFFAAEGADDARP